MPNMRDMQALFMGMQGRISGIFLGRLAGAKRLVLAFCSFERFVYAAWLPNSFFRKDIAYHPSCPLPPPPPPPPPEGSTAYFPAASHCNPLNNKHATFPSASNIPKHRAAMAIPPAHQQHHDIIIVGAGIHGLCAAHTFLSIQPTLSLLLLDEKSTVGGVWAKQSIYPTLRANNLQGYYEFSDFPMLEAGLEGELGVGERSRLSGEAVCKYVERYAEAFGLMGRVRLGCRVVSARDDTRRNGWDLEVVDVGGKGGEVQTIHATKLIIATGQASRPLMPSIPGISSFGKPIIHSSDLGKSGRELILQDPACDHVTVLGGSKSAHDAVYMFATAGKRVTWIIRPRGRGAMPMAKPYTKVGPWALWLEGLLMTRPLSWFGACPWSEGDGFGWIRGLLHGTVWGRWLVKGYFANMTSETIRQTGVLEREKTKVLAPSSTLMWYGTQASILNYDRDFYDVVNDARVEILRDNIVELKSGGDVLLANHRTITTDALVCATGYYYTPTFPLYPTDKQLNWGIPVPAQSDNIFPDLDDKADIQLFHQFPFVASSPAPSTLEHQPGNTTPWRLWRFIAPPSQVCCSTKGGERSLAFLCATTSYQTTIKAEITSLWTYAYLFNQLDIQPSTMNEADVFYEAALWSRYGKWRCPLGYQGKVADFLLDAMPYYDLLLRDLGLRSWRKRRFGWLGEVLGGWYVVRDYRGIVGEWVGKRKGKRG